MTLKEDKYYKIVSENVTQYQYEANPGKFNSSQLYFYFIISLLTSWFNNYIVVFESY